MATLTNKTIASTYTSLLKLEGDTGSTVASPGAAVQVKTGNNDATPLYLNTDRLGIGGQPSYRLSIEGTDATTSTVSVRRNENGDRGSFLNLRKSRGASVGSNAIVNNNDYVGEIFFYGSDGTNDIEAGAIKCYVNGTPGSNDMPGALEFRTTSDGASSSSGRMTINSAGNVIINNNLGIGTASPDSSLDISSSGTQELKVTSSDGIGRFSLTGATQADLVFKDSGGGSNKKTMQQVVMDDVFRFRTLTDVGGVGIDPVLQMDLATGNVGIGMSPDNPFNVKVGTDEVLRIRSDSGVQLTARTENNGSDVPLKLRASTFSFQGGASMELDANSRIILSNNDTNTDNTVFGYNAFTNNGTILGNINADRNTVFGNKAMGTGTTTGGYNNVAIGSSALEDHTSADSCVAIGSFALNNVTSGIRNLGIGTEAGTIVTTGADNISIGSSSNLTSSSASNQTVIGISATAQGDNTVTLGNASVTDVYMSQDSQAYVHAQNVPNHVANTMSSPYYRFDGVDDKITVSDSPHLDGFTNFSVTGSIYLPNTAGNYGIVRKFHTAGQKAWMIYMDANEILYLVVSSDGTNSEEQKLTTALTVGAWNHFALTFDSGTFLGYINGALSGVDANFSTQTSIHSGSDTMVIGNAIYSDYDLEGSIQNLKVFNKTLTATEIKDDYSGASVPFKYKGSTQTNLISSAFQDTAGNEAFSNASASGFTSTNSSANGYVQSADEIALVAGKSYVLNYNAAITSGTYPEVLILQSSGGSHATVGSVEYQTVAGANSFVFTSLVTTNCLIQFQNVGTTNNAVVISGLTITRAGAVAEYDGSSAGSKVWGDKSGNGLHGTVGAGTLDATAPTLENTPYDSGTEYEEGTFTPTIQGIDSNLSYTSQVGHYIKIGSMVTFNVYIATSTGSGGALASANVEVQSLPYTSSATTHNRGSVTIGFFDNFDEDGSSNVNAFVNSNSTVVEFYKMTGARFIGTDMDTAGMELRISGTYFTD